MSCIVFTFDVSNPLKFTEVNLGQLAKVVERSTTPSVSKLLKSTSIKLLNPSNALLSVLFCNSTFLFLFFSILNVSISFGIENRLISFNSIGILLYSVGTTMFLELPIYLVNTIFLSSNLKSHSY